MKLTPGKRKWLKRILIFIIARFVLGGIAYYVIVYKFKSIVQFVVNKESKKNYSFDASDIDVSLWHKTIVVNNAVLSCRDTLHTTPHYDVKIPRVYLAIDSWKDLIFHKRVSVDSLGILLPQFATHVHDQQEKSKHISFQTTEITNILGKVITHLNVRSFSLENGAFTYSTLFNKKTFSSNRINLLIRNFSKKGRSSDYLLSSDDIDIALTDQDWIMPDGYHLIKFSKLHFSGKNGYFEIDSCKFTVLPNEKSSGLTFSSEKLLFKSKQLPAVYEQEKLILDTLICINPVLSLNATTKVQNDSSAAITASVKKLFKGLNFKYVDVRGGQIEFNANNPGMALYSTQKTNLRLYNFVVNPDSTHKISTDSINLNLKNISFLTPDSLFQMNIDELALKNNDVLFKNATFGPTKNNHPEKGFSFSTPLLRLKNVNIENLIRKKIIADSAELIRPVITVYTKGERKKIITNVATDNSAISTEDGGKVDKFYATLHALSELIEVQNFSIRNGDLLYNSTGAAQLKVRLNDLNADILLDHFLTSDSLIDIKRSMPLLAVKKIDITSPNMRLSVDNYHFDGFRRHNSIAHFQFDLHNNMSLAADKIYWEILDWDLWNTKRIIQIDALKIQTITINKHDERLATTKEKFRKNLPVINITRFDLDQLSFYQQSPNRLLNFDARNICTDNIHTKKRFFTWGNIEGTFNNIHLQNQQLNALIKQVSVNSQHESIVRDATVYTSGNGSTASLTIPDLKMKTDIHSTDISTIAIPSIITNNASIQVLARQYSQTTSPQKLTVPANIKTGQLIFSNTSLRYISQKNSDTSSVRGIMNIYASNLETNKKENESIKYDSVAIRMRNVELNKRNLALSLPSAAIILNKGNTIKTAEGNIDLQTSLFVNWANVTFETEKPGNTQLSLSNLSGEFSEKNFSLQTAKKSRLSDLLTKSTISQSHIFYKTKASTIQAGSLTWHPKAGRLMVSSFAMQPNITREEAFKNAKWQADYMTIKAGIVFADGISLKKAGDDSILTIHKILVENADLVTSRDKNIPFNHGKIKPMPTKMIEGIPYPLHIDSVVVKQSNVTIHEISAQTKKEGIIPLKDINAIVTNIGYTDKTNDSLILVAEAHLLDQHIKELRYKESYSDSLSTFSLSMSASPVPLPPLSNITSPLASISVANGNADTLFANFTGNKYAAAGQMNFYYTNLKVKLLNANDTTKSGTLLSLKNWAANNILLKKKNNQYSVAYFERDQEKFVFNYWIKTTLHGLMSSVGIKKSKKYIKQYNKKQQEYSLPKYD